MTETLIGSMSGGKDENFCRAMAGRIQGMRDSLVIINNIAKQINGSKTED